MAVRLSTPLFDSRRAAGYTQEDLAEKLNTDRGTIGRWERGVQSPQPWQRSALAQALKIPLDELDDLLRRTLRSSAAAASRGIGSSFAPSVMTASSPEPLRNDGAVRDIALGVEVVHGAIPRLRRALDQIDLPDDGPTRSMTDLGLDVARISEHRLQARYVDLVRLLPDLIFELARASQFGDGRRRREVARLLTLAFRAADGVAFKFGYLDLSARLIDLMRASALVAEDPLLLATVSYVRTETFFASGDLDTAARALVAAADQVPTGSADSVPAVAAYGALHMRAAVVAGRAGKADAAADHLDEARRVARSVPEGVYHGTAFGPSSLRVHELAVAVELRDSASIHRAAAWHPPRGLPAERRSHYYIDLARGQLDLGHHEDAYLCLETAREVAPQHAREHPQVRQSLSTLLRTHRSPSAGLLDLAAWARAR